MNVRMPIRQLWAGLALAGAALAGEPPPNVVLITVESLRADHVGCYGYARPTTPTLDRVAAEGARFSQAVAASNWTTPALMSIFTGVQPHEHQAVNHRQQLAAGLTTLAAALKQGGYQTASIASNPCINGKFGFDRGFDLYDDFTVFLTAEVDLFADGTGGPTALDRLQTGPLVNRQAIRWLRETRARGRPFFLHVFYFDPHYDYLPPADCAARFVAPGYAGPVDGKNVLAMRKRLATYNDGDRRHLADLYDGELRYTDDQIAVLLAELQALGLYDTSIVIVGGDHGEEFFDHGSVAHGHTLYDELLRVPLLVRFPPRVKAGTVVAGQVQTLELMPTILSWAGLAVPPQCRGRNLLPALTGAQLPDAGPAFVESEVDFPMTGARTLAAKVVHDIRTGAFVGFDLAQDPGERQPLAGDATPALRQLKDALAAWEADMAKRRPASATKPELDDRLRQQLKSLGYLH